MKRLIVLVTCAIFALVGAAQAADVSLSISCVDRTQSDRTVIYFGYTAGETVPGTSYIGPVGEIEGGDDMPNGLEPGEHTRVFSMAVYGEAMWQFVSELGVWEIHVNPETQGPACDGWQPSAPSIKIAAPDAGPYTLEIQDTYGNWSLVTDAAHPDGIVLYNNGGAVELIGSVGQDTDPSHYRLIPHS